MQSFRFLSQARRVCAQFNRDCRDDFLPPCRVYWCDASDGYVLIRTHCELPRIGLRLIPARRNSFSRLAFYWRRD